MGGNNSKPVPVEETDDVPPNICTQDMVVFLEFVSPHDAKQSTVYKFGPSTSAAFPFVIVTRNTKDIPDSCDTVASAMEQLVGGTKGNPQIKQIRDKIASSIQEASSADAPTPITVDVAAATPATGDVAPTAIGTAGTAAADVVTPSTPASNTAENQYHVDVSTGVYTSESKDDNALTISLRTSVVLSEERDPEDRLIVRAQFQVSSQQTMETILNQAMKMATDDEKTLHFTDQFTVRRLTGMGDPPYTQSLHSVDTKDGFYQANPLTEAAMSVANLHKTYQRRELSTRAKGVILSYLGQDKKQTSASMSKTQTAMAAVAALAATGATVLVARKGWQKAQTHWGKMQEKQLQEGQALERELRRLVGQINMARVRKHSSDRHGVEALAEVANDALEDLALAVGIMDELEETELTQESLVGGVVSEKTVSDAARDGTKMELV